MIVSVGFLIVGLIVIIFYQKMELNLIYKDYDIERKKSEKYQSELNFIKATNKKLTELRDQQMKEMNRDTTKEHLAKRIDFESDFSSMRDASAGTNDTGAYDNDPDTPNTSNHTRRATDVSR